MRHRTEDANSQPVHLLGIESSGLACAAGISRDNEVLAKISANIKNIHSRKLLPFVEDVLGMSRLRAEDLSAVVLSAGPGSFTGLRIGYSVAKGLAHALGIPIIETPTLDVWAYQAGRQANPVMPVIDAHRGEIFCAVYRWRQEEFERERDYTLISPENLAEFLPGAVLLAGADARKLFPQLEKFLPQGSGVLHPSPGWPQMWALLELGFHKFTEGQFSHLDSCEPLYLRAFKGAP